MYTKMKNCSMFPVKLQFRIWNFFYNIDDIHMYQIRYDISLSLTLGAAKIRLIWWLTDSCQCLIYCTTYNNSINKICEESRSLNFRQNMYLMERGRKCHHICQGDLACQQMIHFDICRHLTGGSCQYFSVDIRHISGDTTTSLSPCMPQESLILMKIATFSFCWRIT